MRVTPADPLLAALAIAVVLLAVGAAPKAGSEPSAASLLEGMPYSGRDRERLLAGRTVIQPLREAGTRELAVGAACLLPGRSPEGVLAAFLEERPILPEEHVVESGVLRGEVSPALFEPIRLEPNVAAEVARYLKARPGTELNLSTEEIAAFTAIRPSAETRRDIEHVHERLRAFLASRYGGYRERGLDGIPDYERARGSRASPAEELRASTRAAGLDRLAPRFEKAWLEYPSGLSPDASEAFFWARVEVDDRPAVALAHRLSTSEGAVRLVAQRSFYVSHFFDSGESLVAVATAREGTLVLYQDRIWLDEVSGITGRVKKTLGRKFLESHVRETLEALGVCP